MKKAKRRLLSFLMAALVVFTTICGHVDFRAATNVVYNKISSAAEFTSGTYVMIVGTGYAPTTLTSASSPWVLSATPTVEGNQVTDAKGAYYTITVDGTNAKLQDANGAYIAPKGGDNNGIKEGSYDWAWEFDEATGTFKFKGQGSDTVVLASNMDYEYKFRGYKNSTLSGSTASKYSSAFTLYKAGEGSGTGDSGDAGETVEISTIAEALAGAKDEEFTVKGVVTLVDGKNIFVQDETGGICLFTSSAQSDIALGDTVVGTGKKTEYKGLPELTGVTCEKSSGMTLVAKEKTLSELSEEDICTYVSLTGLTVTAVSGTTVTVSDGTIEMPIYNAVLTKGDTTLELKVGDKINLTVAVGIYNSLQLRNTVASEITVWPYDPITDDMFTEGMSTLAQANAATGNMTILGQVVARYGNNGSANTVILEDVINGEIVGFQLYGSSFVTAYEIGDIVKVTGAVSTYNGVNQMDYNATVVLVKAAAEVGGVIQAQELTIKELLAGGDKYLSEYVKIKDAILGTYNSSNTPITEASSTAKINIYKGAAFPEGVEAGDVVDVYGILSKYNTTYQLRNESSENYVGEVTPEEPETPEEDDKTSTIAQALAGADGTEFTVKGVVTLVDGSNIYVQDATGGICLYMSTKPSDIALGDTIIGTGKKSAYNGMPQLSSATYEKATGLTLSAKKATIAGLTTADLGTYVKLTGLEVTEIYDNNGSYSNPNITVTDGTKTIQIYKAQVGKTDGAWNVKVGDVINVKAAVGINKNGYLQLRNTTAAEITEYVKGTEKVTSAAEFTTGTYVLVCKDGYAPSGLNGTWVEVIKPEITDELLTDAKGAVWTLTVTGNEVMLTDSSLQTIAPKGGNNNGISSGSYKWKWQFNDNGTFTFLGQGSDTVTLATNNADSGEYAAYHKMRGYKNTTLASAKAGAYCTEFTLYKVEATSTEVVFPTENSEVVIYNVDAEGVLGAQDDNIESPSIDSVGASLGEDGKVTSANGGVIFKVIKNGEYYRFYNETYGYLCSKDAGNNAYYTLTECDEADWTLELLGDGFKLKSKVAKYNGTSAQYLEYYSDSYKTYSYYGTNKDGTPANTDIYKFYFLPCANEKVIGGIVNEPKAVADKILDANVGADYTFTFEVDAPFGIKELIVKVNGEDIAYKEAAGIYTVVVPAAKVVGETMVITVSGKDNKDVAITGTFNIVVKDEPAIGAVTPVAGAQTGVDKRPTISAVITNAGANATVVMSINGKEVNATYADGKVSYTSADAMEDGRYSVTVTVTRADKKTVTKTWSFTVGKAQYELYFGQMHSHTTYSDGSGSLESALDYILNLPESANVDFVAFTDHSNYFDKSGAANPEGALYDLSLGTADSQTKWTEYKAAVDAFNKAQGSVVALAGFEMTWSGGPGHINTFNTDGIVSRNNTVLNNKTSDAGMKAYYALLSRVEGIASINQFNHPGSTFGTFSDFAYWDAVIDTRFQLVEVGNGEGQIGSGGYFPSYEYYTMALDKGWHLAPTNNQDNHKGKWGNANDARDVVLTDDFSQEGIYQAIRDMRVYATEDKNLEIYYTVNGLQLGSTIAEKPEDPLQIAVSVFDPDMVDSISKVEVIVNSGKVAYTWSDPAVLAKGDLTCELEPTYSYYYIRVTQGDGDLAVTSPVWVGETLKLGISSVECGTSTPVTGEEVTLTTTLFNSEDKDLSVKALTYTVNGSQVIGTDTERHTVKAYGTEKIEFKFTPEVAKLTKVTVTAIVELDKVEYTFSMDITLDVQDASKLAYIGIDAAHYNEYVAGNYKDSMGNFGKLAADYSVRTVDLKTSKDLIDACSNPKYKALILTAPSRRLADAQTDPKVYTAEEIAAIREFNANGGTIIIAGWSDNYENYDVIQNNDAILHMAETQNKLLEALGSSLRIGDDATYDDVRSAADGVDKWRLYFNTYGKNFLTEGVEVDSEHPYDRLYTEVFSHYGGASVYVVDANGNPTATLPSTVSPVVFGHGTTYSVDVDEDGLGGDSVPKYAYAENDNRLMAMAMEQLEGQGAIIVAGAAFMSNFEVQATIEDSGAEKNYANYKICENLVQYVNPVVVTPIAEVQAQKEVGYKYTVEGIVTSNASGYDKDTAFFDCIYVQDATGGVCCFPVAGNFKIGDKVRVTGTTEFYQGEMELQVTDIEVIGSGTVSAKEVTAAQINDLSVLGQLVKVSGTVVGFEEANGLIQTIMVQDATGNVARVFIDGYITTAKDVQSLVLGCEITVTGLASYDNTFNAPDGPFPRIRVRDRADVVCKEAPAKDEPIEIIIPSNGTVEEKAEIIVDVIEKVETGNDVVVKVENTETKEVEVSIEVFQTLEENKEKEVTLVVELANGFTWTIDSTTVDTSKLDATMQAIDLWVEIVEEVIPEKIVEKVVEEGETSIEISLGHNGDFGFEAKLNVPLGDEFAGKKATLYYFNEAKKALEKQEDAVIGKDGYAKFTFTHASDYVVVISAEEVKAPETGDNTNVALYVSMLLVGAGLALISRKKRNTI